MAKKKPTKPTKPAAPPAANKPRPIKYIAPAGGLRIRGTTYRSGEAIPAKLGRLFAEAQETARRDEKSGVSFGKPSFPHIQTFRGIATTAAHVYRNPDEAIKDSRPNALRMRRDCDLMLCVESRQRAVALLNWHIEPENPKSTEQRELCTELTNIVKKIPRFTEYRRNLLEAVWYGRYAINNEYNRVYVDGKPRTAGITKWRPINGDKLAFRYDDGSGEYNDDQIGILVNGAFAAGDTYKGRRLEATDWGLAYFLDEGEQRNISLHKHMIEDAAFEDYMSAGSIHGVGLRSRIYYTWLQAQEVLAMLMEYIERTGQGIEIYYYPFGSPEGEAKMAEVAINKRASNVILMPRMSGDPSMDAFGIERIDPSPAGAEALKNVRDEFFGHIIKRYILGQTLTTVAQGTGLGSGLSDLQNASFQEIIRYDATNLEETITLGVVNRIKELCFPAAKRIDCYLKIETESPETEKKLSAYRQAYEMGAKIKASDVMDAIGASKPTEQDEVLQNPMIKQQERLWKQQEAQDRQAQGIGFDFGGGEDPNAGPSGPGGDGPSGPSGEDLGDLFGPLANGIGGPAAGGPLPYWRKATESPLLYREETGAAGVVTSTDPKPPKSPNATATKPVASNTATPSPKPTPATTLGPDLSGKTSPTTPPATEPAKMPEPETPEPKIDAGNATDNVAAAETEAGLPAGLSTGEKPQPGEIRKVGGKSYRFNANSRWESADGGDGTQGDENAPVSDAKQQKSPANNAGPSLVERQSFAAQSLSKVHAPAASIMRAMQASPEFSKGGEYSTHQFAPEQVSAVHQEFAANVGKEYNGGQVVDLSAMYGQGAIGYSSPAGAMVLVPPASAGTDAAGGASGGSGRKWQVHYTVMTGPVQRAMSGDQTPVNNAGGADGVKEATKQQPAAAQQPAPYALADTTKPPVMATPEQMAGRNEPFETTTAADRAFDAVTGGLEKASNVIGSVKDRLKAKLSATVKGGAKPAAATATPTTPAAEQTAVPAEVTEPTTPAATDVVTPNTTPEAATPPAAPANPVTPAAPVAEIVPPGQPDAAPIAPPVDPRPARAQAEQVKQQRDALVAEWNQKTEQLGDLMKPADNARYRSQIAALNSQLSVLDKDATAAEKEFEQTENKAAKQVEKQQTARQKLQEKLLKMQADLKARTEADAAKQAETQQKTTSKQQQEEIQRTGKTPDGRDLHTLTRDEFSQHLPVTKHKQYVVDALRRGVDVPDNVKAEYPELVRENETKKVQDEARAARAQAMLERLRSGKRSPSGLSEPDKAVLKVHGGLTDEQINALSAADAENKLREAKANVEKKAAEAKQAEEQQRQAKTQQEEAQAAEQRNATVAALPDSVKSTLEGQAGDELFYKHFGRVENKENFQEAYSRLGDHQKQRAINLVAQYAKDNNISDPAEIDSLMASAARAATGRNSRGTTAVSAIASEISQRQQRQAQRQQRQENTPDKVIARAAQQNNVSPDDLNMAIDEVHTERARAHQKREQEKADIRKQLGMNASQLSMRESKGKDWTSIKGIDHLVERVMNQPEEYPYAAAIVNSGQDPTDALLEFVKEGADAGPKRHDDDVIKEALGFLKLKSQLTREPGEDDEFDDTEQDNGSSNADSRNRDLEPLPFARDKRDRSTWTPSQRSAMTILYKRQKSPDLFAI